MSSLTMVFRTHMFSLQGPQQGMLEGDFALCISLYHGYELLMQMGLRSLFFYIQGIMDGSRGQSPHLQVFRLFIRTNSEPEAEDVSSSHISSDFHQTLSYPKFIILCTCCMHTQ